jgi:hypothetical protein
MFRPDACFLFLWLGPWRLGPDLVNDFPVPALPQQGVSAIPFRDFLPCVLTLARAFLPLARALESG